MKEANERRILPVARKRHTGPASAPRTRTVVKMLQSSDDSGIGSDEDEKGFIFKIKYIILCYTYINIYIFFKTTFHMHNIYVIQDKPVLELNLRLGAF